VPFEEEGLLQDFSSMPAHGMPETSGKFGTSWTEEDIQLLQKLVGNHVAIKTIAAILDRTEVGIRSKAQDLGLSLKGRGAPTNNDKS
jgi:hypothetical protein